MKMGRFEIKTIEPRKGIQELGERYEALLKVARAAKVFMDSDWEFDQATSAPDEHDNLVHALRELPDGLLEE